MYLPCQTASWTADPLVFLSIVAQPNRMRGAVYYPCIAARIQPLRVAVGEGLVWRLFSFANLLSNRLADVMAASSTNSSTGAGGGGSTVGLQRSGSAARAGQVAGGRAGPNGGASQQVRLLMACMSACLLFLWSDTLLSVIWQICASTIGHGYPATYN
jgi:hypothetical protein